MPQSAQGGYLCQRQQPRPSPPPEGEQLGVGLSEKHRHISNLVFRADSMPSFQIQTALKIMLARHRVPITAHLCPIIRQRQLRLVRGSAAHQQSGKWIPRMPGPQGDAAAGPQSPPPPGGWGGRTLQLNGRLGAPTASGQLLVLGRVRGRHGVRQQALGHLLQAASSTAWGLGSGVVSSSSRVLDKCSGLLT